MRNGLIISLVLHVVVVVLAVVGLPFLKADPPVMADRPIIVDLVQVGERTAAPPPEPKKKDEPKPKPVEKKKPDPKPEPVPPTPPEPEPEPAPEPEPVPAPPPPPEPEPEPQPEPAPDPEPEVEKTAEQDKAPRPQQKPKPPEKPEPPKKKVAKKDPPKKPEPTKKKKKDDPFKSLLQNVEKFRDESDAPREKEPETTQQAQASNSENAKIRNAPVASRATMSELDAIRRQIEEKWIVDPGALGIQDMVVRLRVLMNPDGTVADVKVLDTSRYYAEPAFRAVAESAVRAVYKASPLEYPSQKYNEFKVMELNFRPEEQI